jgi:hypothetical protein
VEGTGLVGPACARVDQAAKLRGCPLLGVTTHRILHDDRPDSGNSVCLD